VNKGGTVLGVLLLLFGGTALAQQLSHQVLVPAAGIGICSSSDLSQTIGENAVVIFSTEKNDLTQGFQQPRLKLVQIDQPQGTGVKVYPVPATDFLNIELYGETEREYVLSLLDISGRLVHTEKLYFSDSYWFVHTLQVRQLVRGLYFIRVRCTEGKIDRTFKISLI
jgi:hypothetical protein